MKMTALPIFAHHLRRNYSAAMRHCLNGLLKNAISKSELLVMSLMPIITIYAESVCENGSDEYFSKKHATALSITYTR